MSALTQAQPDLAVHGGSNETVNLFVREITVLDYAYLDPVEGPLGGSLDVDVTFTGDLDEEGVVFDFSLAKKAVKRVIDDLCDHRLVMPSRHAVALEGGVSRVTFKNGPSEFTYTCPSQGLCLLDVDDFSVEAMKSYLEAETMKVMPENVDKVTLRFREENLGEAPHYRYTHGLKQHYGNCQRLLHGHRNRVDVTVDGEHRPDLEARICESWKNIHLAYPDNVVGDGHLLGQRQDHLNTIEIRYTASQGDFHAHLPGRDVYIMAAETTVENIGRHLRDRVQEWVGPDASVEVHAYEGIRKGSASASR